MNTSLFTTETFFTSLPKEITDNYSVQSTISINRHNAVFMVKEKNKNQTFILKVLDREYYHKSLYKKIFSLTDSYLLLPIYSISDSASICSLYPQMLPLPEVLYTKGMNYSMLQNLVSDIGKAVHTLHSHQILHLDITPDNIFMDTEGHFFLGDFSSSQFMKKTSLLFFNHHSRTGSTPAFSLPPAENTEISYWNDCYSFALVLYMLCNYGNLPGGRENNISPFDSLLFFLEKNLQRPGSIHQNLVKEWIEKVESLFTICNNDSACKKYHFQIDSNTLDVLSVSTLEDIPANHKLHIEKNIRPLRKHIFSVPVPFYGLLLLCTFILIFSIYCHLSKSNNKNTALIPSGQFTNIESPSPPTASPAATKKAPAPSPHPTKETEDSVLNLSKIHCKNQSFQIELTRKPFIKILFANHCNLKNTIPFSGLRNLEELYLFDNDITTPKGFKRLTNLKILVLSKNKITDLAPLKELRSLTMLDLSHNHHLKHIHALSDITNLQTLILTNTNATQKEITYIRKKLPNCMVYY